MNDTSPSTDIDAWLAGDDAPLAEPVAAPAALPPPPDGPASLLEAVTALERAAEPDAPRPAVAAPTVGSVPRYVLFSVADAYYAVPQPFVTELDRVPAITFVPNVPAWVCGVTNRRGDILSVVDTRALLGCERAVSGGRMLVVRLLDDSCAVGLLVDEVQQIVAVATEHIRPPGPVLEGPLVPFLTGLVELDQRTVALLDLDRLLRSSLLRQFDDPANAAPR